MALVFLSVFVVLCRSRGRERLWCFVDICRIVSVERERGFVCLVGICRIVSVEGESAAMAFCRYLSYCVGRGGECGFCFLSITVVLCRTRGCEALVFLSIFVALCRSRVGARLWRFVDNCRIVSVKGGSAALAFCRYLSHCVGRGEERGNGVLSITVALCRMREERGFGVLSITVVLCRTMGGARLWRFVDICRIVSVEGRVRIRRGCRARQRGCARYKHSF